MYLHIHRCKKMYEIWWLFLLQFKKWLLKIYMEIYKVMMIEMPKYILKYFLLFLLANYFQNNNINIFQYVLILLPYLCY